MSKKLKLKPSIDGEWIKKITTKVAVIEQVMTTEKQKTFF